MCRLSWNLRASTSWDPQGLSRPVMGLLYFYLYNFIVPYFNFFLPTVGYGVWSKDALNDLAWIKMFLRFIATGQNDLPRRGSRWWLWTWAVHFPLVFSISRTFISRYNAESISLHSRHLLGLSECSRIIVKDLKMFPQHILKYQTKKGGGGLFLFVDDKMSLSLVSGKWMLLITLSIKHHC